MIENIEKDSFLVVCDGHGCKASLDVFNTDFLGAVKFLKDRDWKVTKVFGTWQHLCPKCQRRKVYK